MLLVIACGGLAAIAARISVESAVDRGPTNDPGCTGWNADAHFEFAVGDEIGACLAAAAGPDAKDHAGRKSLHSAVSHSNNLGLTQALVAVVAERAAMRIREGTPPRLAEAFVRPIIEVIAILLRMGTGGAPANADSRGRGIWRRTARMKIKIPGRSPVTD